MASSPRKRRDSTQWKSLNKIYQFNEEDKNDAIKAVQGISQRAMKTALDDSTRSMVFAFDMLEIPSDEPKTHPFSTDLNSDYSHSSNLSQERAIFRGSNRG